MKLYPYTPNLNAVRKHFVDMAEGKEQIGYGFKGKYNLMKQTNKTPRIQLLTPTAMAVEQAKVEVKPLGTLYRKAMKIAGRLSSDKAKSKKHKSKRLKTKSKTHKDNFSR